MSIPSIPNLCKTVKEFISHVTSIGMLKSTKVSLTVHAVTLSPVEIFFPPLTKDSKKQLQYRRRMFARICCKTPRRKNGKHYPLFAYFYYVSFILYFDFCYKYF